MINLLRQCVLFWDLLAAFTRRELRQQFRGTLFGPLWIILQPILFLVIYFVVFVEFLRTQGTVPDFNAAQHPLAASYNDHKPMVHALSMFAGLIPWFSFAEALSRSTNCIHQNGNLIKKFSFPTEILPVYMVLVGMINMTVGFLVLVLAVGLILGGLPSLVWLFPFMLVLQAVFTLGVTYLVSATAVFIRDLTQIIPMVVTFWFFLSPIFYVTRSLRSDLAWVLKLNPVTYLVETYRQIFVLYPGLFPGTSRGDIPWQFMGTFALIAFAVFFLGYFVFMRFKPRFADEV